MANIEVELELFELFSALSESLPRYKDKSQALKRITEIGKAALGSHACTLVFVDLENKYMTIEACAGLDADFEKHMTGKRIRMGTLGDGVFVDFDLIAKRELVEKYGLQRDSQGVANPQTALRCNLNAVLGYPLESDGRLIGYFNHFSSNSDPFAADKKRLLSGIFARQAMIAIEQFEQLYRMELLSSILKNLSQSLLLVSPSDFLKQVSDKACELLSIPLCIVWKLDEKQKELKIVATSGDVDDEYKKIKLSIDNLEIKPYLFPSSKGVWYLRDVTQPHPNYEHSLEAKARGWVSLLSAGMWGRDHLIGMIDVYTKSARFFKEWEKESFGAFANCAALSIQKAEELTSRKRLEKLNEIMQEMAQARDVDDLLKLLLDRGLELVGSTRGWISRLDLQTGELHIVAHRGNPPILRPLRPREGITGKALQDEKPIRVDDVRSSEWQGVFVEFWPDTRSELAIPILVSNAQVQMGREVTSSSKTIGVFNIESRTMGAFSQADQDILWPLAGHAAILIERLEFDQKLTSLNQIEKEIVGKRDWDDIIQTLMRGITDTLRYAYVNISLVNPKLNRIKTEYITGIPENEVEEFKRMADHSLDSDDIQAHIVKSREIEVPSIEDERFDCKIYERFDHHRLIRVFVPMIASSDCRVIGTIETGYERGYRKYIYERDVQILKMLVDYAVRALEQRERGLLDRISHEFRSAIVGIRNNASFLQRRIEQLDDVLIQQKFDDILTDCEILLFQVQELEHILGRPSPISKIERTLVFRDVIIKTVKQLRPLVVEQRFSISEPTRANIHKIPPIYVDKAKLNQVVYNLLINSIKYAKNDPNAFAIRIEVDETKNEFIIKFKDWGIGIRKELEEKIFEEGFRTPEAINKHVAGSGLGLTIARKIMKELGGDLKLANNYKPTEFHMVLPKCLKEVPDDTLR